MSQKPPVDDLLASLLGYQVRRLSLLVMADLQEALAPLELKAAEASVLLVIGSTPGVKQSEIGRILGIERANMTPLIARLESRGLLQREDLDGRSQAIQLTAEGRRLRTRARNALEVHEQRCFGSIAEEDRVRLTRELNALWRRLERASGG